MSGGRPKKIRKISTRRGRDSEAISVGASHTDASSVTTTTVVTANSVSAMDLPNETSRIVLTQCLRVADGFLITKSFFPDADTTQGTGSAFPTTIMIRAIELLRAAHPRLASSYTDCATLFLSDFAFNKTMVILVCDFKLFLRLY